MPKPSKTLTNKRTPTAVQGKPAARGRPRAAKPSVSAADAETKARAAAPKAVKQSSRATTPAKKKPGRPAKTAAAAPDRAVAKPAPALSRKAKTATAKTKKTKLAATKRRTASADPNYTPPPVKPGPKIPPKNSKLGQKIVSVLRDHAEEGAVYTSDIAYYINAETPATRAALKRLQSRGIVERVVTSTPSSWKLSHH